MFAISIIFPGVCKKKKKKKSLVMNLSSIIGTLSEDNQWTVKTMRFIFIFSLFIYLFIFIFFYRKQDILRFKYLRELGSYRTNVNSKWPVIGHSNKWKRLEK